MATSLDTCTSAMDTDTPPFSPLENQIKSLSTSLTKFKQEFKEQFDCGNVDEKIALPFAKQLADLSDFIIRCYSHSGGSLEEQDIGDEDNARNDLLPITPKSLLDIESSGLVGAQLVESPENDCAIVEGNSFPLTNLSSATSTPQVVNVKKKINRPKQYTCGAGYSCTDENEKFLTEAVKTVITKQMHLLKNRLKKKDMFYYMAHSTICHLLCCYKDKRPSFSDEILMEWAKNYHDNGYEAMKSEIQGQPKDSRNISPTSPLRKQAIHQSQVINADESGNLATIAYKLLKKKAAEWIDIGRELDVPYERREELEREVPMSSKTKLEKILRCWVETKCSEVSMANLKKVMKELKFNDILHEIEKENKMEQ